MHCFSFYLFIFFLTNNNKATQPSLTPYQFFFSTLAVFLKKRFMGYIYILAKTKRNISLLKGGVNLGGFLRLWHLSVRWWCFL